MVHNEVTKMFAITKNYPKIYRDKFVANSLDGMFSRGISSYAAERFTQEWNKPEKQLIAKEITLSTIVPTFHSSRENAALQPPFPNGKRPHPSVVHALGKTYGKLCAIDKISAVCPEHYLLMRTAVGIARNPKPEILHAATIIGFELGTELEKLNRNALKSLFEIGASAPESRSRDVLENHDLLIKILKGEHQTTPQQFLRVLEVVLSPLGMIANAYGSNNCKIERAKNAGKDVVGLENFIKELMDSLKSFHVPYIKAPGSPFAHLQMQLYTQGAQISDAELVTVSHFLESLANKSTDDPMPNIPQLRSVIVNDATGRTLHLHDHMNLPHFFDVSGTTGAIMQASLGLLFKAGRLDLAKDPHETLLLGMVIAGCNFYKQGYHNYYEVLPALNWVNHNVWKEEYKQLTPTELLHTVPSLLKECVDPSSQMATIINDTTNLVTEHFELHYELYKEDLQNRAKIEQDPSAPMLGMKNE